MASWVADGVQAAEFEALGGELRLVRDEGLPGRALAPGEPIWLQDFSADDRLPRARAARQAGLHAGCRTAAPGRRPCNVSSPAPTAPGRRPCDVSSPAPTATASRVRGRDRPRRVQAL